MADGAHLLVQVALEQRFGLLPEQADASGVLKQQKAHAMGKKCRVFELGGRVVQAERPKRVLARLQRGQQQRIEMSVQFVAQAAWRQPLDQIKTQVQIAGISGVEVKPGVGGLGQGTLRPAALASGTVDGGLQPRQRFAEQFGVDRLFAGEIRIDRPGGVAGTLGDDADAGPFEPLLREHGAGRVEHERPPGVHQRLLTLLTLLPMPHGLGALGRRGHGDQINELNTHAGHDTERNSVQ